MKVSGVKMNDVAEWLAGLSLAEYAAAFAENFVDMAVLPHLTEQDLKDLGVVGVGHRRRLIVAMEALKRAAADRGEKTRATGDAGPAVAGTRKASPEVAAGSRSGAERRHLTVMFCDLVGSTELSTRLDPEDMREIFLAYQARCNEVVTGYDGFVAQYRGDGIMAYFGYPRAHENDAERAVRAALDIIAAMADLAVPGARPIEVRVGIATGHVVVGDLVGEGAARERTVIGDAPNLAARLQALAVPGAVVVSPVTRQLLGDLFHLQDLGAQTLKGFAEPVRAFAVQKARSWESRFEARIGGLSGFVGRKRECSQLIARQQAAWQGSGQVVLLYGEAGIGKSRIAAWLAEAVGGQPHARVCYQCAAHHSNSPLHPAIAQIEFACGIASDDSAERRLEKLEAGLRQTGLEPAASVPLVAAMLAVPTGLRYPPLELTPGQQRQRTLAVILAQIVGLARLAPVFFLLEDAHWADPTTLELLRMIVARIADLPVIALVTARPDFVPPWSETAIVSTLTLGRFDQATARSLVSAVAGGATLPPEVTRQLVDKADGIPLFVEELTKTVLESGHLVEDNAVFRLEGTLPELMIPATLQDSLMARLDRSNPVKEIAQIGAAIGRTFAYRLLASVAAMDELSIRTALAKLEEAELASREGVPPDATYTFKHALVQDAAYESLLKTRRSTIHGRIAAAMREQFPDVAQSRPELIANHLTKAAQIPAAIEWWGKAGELALRRSAHREAIIHLEKAIQLADRLPEAATRNANRVRLQIGYAQSLLAGRGYGDPQTMRAFTRARELAEIVGDPNERFAASYGLWAGSFIRAEPGPLHEMAELFRRAAPTLGSSAASCVAWRVAGVTRFMIGDYATARTYLERAVDDFDDVRDAGSGVRFGQNIGIPAIYYLAFVLWPLGDFARTRALVDRGLAVARQDGHIPTLLYALACHGLVEIMRADHAGVLCRAEELTALAREHALPFWIIAANLMQGWVNWHAGAHEAGEAMLRGAEAVCRQQGVGFLRPRSILTLAEIEHLSGRAGQALATLDAGAIENAATRQTFMMSELHRMRGRALRMASPPDDGAAAAAFVEALRVARSQGTRTFELRAALDLGKLHLDAGRSDEARDLLAAALVGFTPTAELPDIGEAVTLLTRLDASSPRPEQVPP